MVPDKIMMGMKLAFHLLSCAMNKEFNTLLKGGRAQYFEEACNIKPDSTQNSNEHNRLLVITPKF